jgi:hypothetical protein
LHVGAVQPGFPRRIAKALSAVFIVSLSLNESGGLMVTRANALPALPSAGGLIVAQAPLISVI